MNWYKVSNTSYKFIFSTECSTSWCHADHF